jgi:hypothetical protein
MLNMTTEELHDLAYEIVEGRGEMPDELRLQVGEWLIEETGDDPYEELFACWNAMESGIAENIADAAWIAATVIVARHLETESAFVSDF